jgi:hypothetical protein
VNIPDSITKAPIVFLTGAGASAPLGLHPTRDFLTYFSGTPLNQLDLGGQSVLSEVVNQVRILAATQDIDIERILSGLERNVYEVDHLMGNPTFVRSVLGGGLQGAGIFKGANERSRSYL